MSNLFCACDGDNAGNQVGLAVLHDDVGALSRISRNIESGGELIKQWVSEHAGHMISQGGDEATFIISSEKRGELETLRKEYARVTNGITLTIGCGDTLSEAGKSLIAGKLHGKNQIVDYSEHVEEALNRAHQEVEMGHGDEEAVKQDEAYLSHMDDESSQDDHYAEHFEDNLDNPNVDHSYEMQEDSEEHPQHLAQAEENHISLEEHPSMQKDDDEEQNIDADESVDQAQTTPEEDKIAAVAGENNEEMPKDGEEQQDESNIPQMDTHMDESEHQESSPELQMLQQMLMEVEGGQDESEQGHKLHSMVGSVLDNFIQHKQDIEQLKGTPSYDAIMGMLSAMILMARHMFQDQHMEPDMDDEGAAPSPELDQAMQAPDMQATPPNAGGMAQPPKLQG